MKTVTTDGSVNVTGNPNYGTAVHNTEVSVDIAPKRVSWTAVIAGAVLALVAQLLLSTLGTAIGLSTVDPLQPGGTPSGEAIGVGAVMWWIVTGFFALMFGGWVAGKLSASPWTFDGALHGLLSFALVTLIGTYIVGSALSGLVRSGVSIVSSGTSTALESMINRDAPSGQSMQGSDIANRLQNDLIWEDIKRDAQAIFANADATAANNSSQPRAENSSGAVPREFDALLVRLASGRNNNSADTDSKAMIKLLTTRAGMTRKDAEARVEDWESTIRSRSQQIAQEAREAADDTARVLSKTALWGFIALLVGATGALVGGALGTNKLGRTPARNFNTTSNNEILR